MLDDIDKCEEKHKIEPALLPVEQKKQQEILTRLLQCSKLRLIFSPSREETERDLPRSQHLG
jgi:hypothetical protein